MTEISVGFGVFVVFAIVTRPKIEIKGFLGMSLALLAMYGVGKVVLLLIGAIRQ